MSRGGMHWSPRGLLSGRQWKGKSDVLNRTRRTYDEAVDDAVAASLGRSRMADGRRIELSVEELALAVGAADDGLGQEGRGADGS